MRRVTASHMLAGTLALAAAWAGVALAASPATQGDALRARYAARNIEAGSPFGIPLHIASEQREHTLEGDIDSRLDHRFTEVREVLRERSRWCEIMILHPNVTHCRVAAGDAAGGERINVRLGRAGHEVVFAFKTTAMTDDYLDVRLEAAEGPAGTTDYRIRVEAAPLADRTVLHLAYAHGYGPRARLALEAYFNTLGRDKVGFTIVGRDADGTPRYVDRLRGGLERNAVRYYLAIRSYLEAIAQPASRRLEQGLQNYVAYTKRWPRQLGEGPGYVERKRADFARMRTKEST